MADAPEVVELFEAIAALAPRAIAFEGTVVRSVATRFANEFDFLSGAGAAQSGGRWNRRGIPAIYASLDVVTATQEAYQSILRYGFAMTTIRPRVVAGALVELGRVLDLTQRSSLRRLGFSQRDLMEEDWQGIQSAGEESWTQAIGRGCRQARFEALLVPSAQCRGGRNLVIFPDRLQPTSRIEILAGDDLPPPLLTQ